jgi:DNA-binding CsgD family transcriptional regulator/tetratricopeptide (TPR) repeat protein
VSEPAAPLDAPPKATETEGRSVRLLRVPARAPELVALAIVALGKDPLNAMRLADQALAAPGLTPRLALDALRVQGTTHLQQGQLAEALAVQLHIQSEAHRLGDARREARALNDLGVVHLKQGRLQEALKALAGAVSLAGPGTELAAAACANIGLIAEQVGENQLFLEFQQAAMVALPEGPSRTVAAINCAVALCRLGRLGEARATLEQVLTKCDPSVVDVISIGCTSLLCWIDAKLGLGERATMQLERVIQRAQASGLKLSEIKTRMVLGEVLTMRGQYAQAVATVEACAEQFQVGGAALEVEVADWLSQCYAQLGRWQEAYQTLRLARRPQGGNVEMHEHFLIARRFIQAHDARRTQTASDDPPIAGSICAMARRIGVSSSDAVMLNAVARGLSNRAIAEQMGLSAHTVRNRLARLMRKLGVNTRAAAVTQAVELGLVVAGGGSGTRPRGNTDS